MPCEPYDPLNAPEPTESLCTPERIGRPEPIPLPEKLIPDHTALRALLRRMQPKMDTDAALDALAYGTLSGRIVPEMGVTQLSKHLPKRTAEVVHLLPAITRATMRNTYPAHPKISCKDEAGRFLRCRFLGQRYEHCNLLLLRKNHYLITDIMIQSGTLDSLPFYPRNILEAVLDAEADAVVISHNHPGGTREPSLADIDSTRSLIRALAPLEIPLLDHLIYARDEIISIRECGYITEPVWMQQPNHCPKLLGQWLTPSKD